MYDNTIFFGFYPMTWIASYAKKKYNINYVYWNPGFAYPELFPSVFERLYMRLIKKLNKMSIKNADSAISISEFLKKELKEETGLDSVVKYPTVDSKIFNKKVKGNVIREKYDLRKDPVCLYVGRISPHKGVHLLIKAFNLVIEEVPNAKLLVVGKPTFDKYFKKLKKISNKNIIFTGFVADGELPLYYGSCDVYVTASLWEGFDIPIVEAQACGKKVVAFDIGSHPEVIDKNGILVKALA